MAITKGNKACRESNTDGKGGKEKEGKREGRGKKERGKREARRDRDREKSGKLWM